MKVHIHDTIKDYKKRQFNRMNYVIYSILLFCLGLILYSSTLFKGLVNSAGVLFMLIGIILFVMVILANRSDKKEFKHH